jgi:hypothetical protein
MKPRAWIRRRSPKKAASDRAQGKRVFSTIPRSQKPVKKRNAKRSEKEFARCFHSVERVEFVKTLACAASGLYAYPERPIENAHVCDDGTKGASRRSGYACIAPLLVDVHRLLHDDPEKFRWLYPLFNAKAAAARTQAAWLARNT